MPARPARARARRIALAATLLATVTATAACGGGSSGADGPPTSTGTPSATATPTDTASPAATSTWSATPASGIVISFDHVAVNAPAGWKPTEKMVTFHRGAGDRTNGNTLSVGELPATPRPLDEEAARAIKFGGFYDLKPKYVGNVDINGVPAYHVAGPIDRYTYIDSYGGFYDNTAFDITLQTNIDDPKAAERQQLVDSVLASVQWK